MRLTTTVFFHRCFDKRRFQSFLHWFLKKSPRGQSRLLKFLEKLKFLGFHSATEAGFSISIEDLTIPSSKSALLQVAEKSVLDANVQFLSGYLTTIEHYQRILEIWHRTSEKLKYQVLQSFQSLDLLNPVYLMAFSGARGNISQIRQLVGMRGLMADPQGQIIDFPIRSNFREGLTLTEYLISCSGARKGIVDTALRTAASGYLTRRLVDVAHHVVISQIDCHLFTQSSQPMGIYVESLYDQQKEILPLKQRLIGRVLAENISIPQSNNLLGLKNQEISPNLSQKICSYRKKVFVRSPLTCLSSKFICQLCYGWNLAEGQLVSIGEAVGVLAAQSIGEPGTQLTMRTFHTGGVFTGRLLDQTYAPFSGQIHYPSLCYGLLIRTLQGQIAYLSKNSGLFSLRVSSFFAQRQQQLEKIYWKLNKIISLHSQVTINTNPLIKNLLEIQFVFQKTTLLYARQGEWVKKTQLLAEIPFLEIEESSENEQEVFSPISGEMHFENLIFLEKTVNEQMVRNFVQVLSEFWILSGDPLKFSIIGKNFKGKQPSVLKKNRFFKKFDLVNNQVAFFQVQLQPFISHNGMGFQFVPQAQFQLYALKNRNFSIFSIFFKNKGYLQVPHQAFWSFIKKKNVQILNGTVGREATNESFLKNEKKIPLFQTWKMGLHWDYFHVRSQLFPINLKSKSFQVVFWIEKNSIHYSSSLSKKVLCEYPKFCILKNFFLQENTCVLHLTRQGYQKFFSLYQNRKILFFFQNQQQNIQKKKIETTFHPKNVIHQQLMGIFFPRLTNSQNIFSLVKKKRCPSFLSVYFFLFFEKFKFFQNCSSQWYRQNFHQRPKIVHWKNFSHHKYFFCINFFQPFSTFIYGKVQFVSQTPIKMGLFCSIRVFFCQKKSAKFINSLKKLKPSFVLSKQNFPSHQNFFQFLLSFHRLFYKNFFKKYKQKKYHLLVEFTQLSFPPTSSTFYSIFFIQSFLQKKFNKSLTELDSLNFSQQFIKKQLNNLQFETFKEPSINDIWPFFGDNETFFKISSSSTYVKTFVFTKAPYRQLKNEFWTVWPPIQNFSKRRKRKKRPLSKVSSSFFLKKILPFSITERSTLLENDFYQTKIFPLNRQFFSAKLQKWRVDFFFKPYSSILQTFGLIKNFEMRFSQKFPKKPIYNNFFLKKETQFIHYSKIQKFTKLINSHRWPMFRDFQNFYIEYISKKSSTFEEGFHHFEKKPKIQFHTYTFRFCSSLLIPQNFQEHFLVGKKNLSKKIFLNFERSFFICSCRNQNFYYLQMRFLKKFMKKNIQPNFQLFTHIKKFLQRFQKSLTKNSEKKFHYLQRLSFDEWAFFIISFSQKKFQVSLSSFQPYRGPRATKLLMIKTVFENTPLLTLRFFKTRNLGFQKKSLQILQKKFHPRCLEKQIFVRFYLPFSDGEMIHDHPMFLNSSNLFRSARWREKAPFPSKFQPISLPTTSIISSNNLKNWQFLYLKFRFYHTVCAFSSQTLAKFQEKNRIQLGNFLKAGDILGKNLSIFNSGQLLAKTRQSFLFRKATIHLLNDQSILHVQHGEIISKHQRMYSVFYHQSKTGDIVQGIPKIEEIFEARKKSKYSLHRLLSKDIFENQIFNYLHNLQKSVIQNIQRIYCGQGVHIADKHIEIIIRQMTSNVLILEPGQTGLLYGEIVAFQWIVKIHSTILSHQVVYEPLFLGITKTCLETSSFLSAASFQETTRILSRAALQNQIDFLRGLKQNVLLGNLLPIGTGCFRPLCT